MDAYHAVVIVVDLSGGIGVDDAAGIATAVLFPFVMTTATVTLVAYGQPEVFIRSAKYSPGRGRNYEFWRARIAELKTYNVGKNYNLFKALSSTQGYYEDAPDHRRMLILIITGKHQDDDKLKEKIEEV
ncbi:unnamed protein product [Strongylus vulgaris]|uniref:VWFA domain-containing protein n=1 Tax=Strongylus vulgaris TaxID=40348 RepID=A0A3P7KMZ4_STRVU|nr:unnamed protein product [Strongylus vulgaris]